MFVPLWASQGWFCGWPLKFLIAGGVGGFFGRHDLEQPLGCALIRKRIAKIKTDLARIEKDGAAIRKHCNASQAEFQPRSGDTRNSWMMRRWQLWARHLGTMKRRRSFGVYPRSVPRRCTDILAVWECELKDEVKLANRLAEFLDERNRG